MFLPLGSDNKMIITTSYFSANHTFSRKSQDRVNQRVIVSFFSGNNFNSAYTLYPYHCYSFEHLFLFQPMLVDQISLEKG